MAVGAALENGHSSLMLRTRNVLAGPDVHFKKAQKPLPPPHHSSQEYSYLIEERAVNKAARCEQLEEGIKVLPGPSALGRYRGQASLKFWR